MSEANEAPSTTATADVEQALGSLNVAGSSDGAVAANGTSANRRRNDGKRGDKAATNGGGGGGGNKKGRPRDNDSPVMQLSKALAYMLRHGTLKEGLTVRADGYVPLNDVLARPKVAKLVMLDTGEAPALDDVRAIVEANDKKRFELKHDDDMQQWLIRAVQGHSIAQVTQLDHVTLTLDNLHLLAGDEAKVNPSTGLPDGVEILHGTTRDAWNKIQASGGLHRMQRNHIHLAKGRPSKSKSSSASPSSQTISGMRASSPVILHIDIIAALRDGITFYLASNGAVLTSGKDDSGQLPLQYIVRAEDSKTGATIWQREQ